MPAIRGMIDPQNKMVREHIRLSMTLGYDFCGAMAEAVAMDLSLTLQARIQMM